MINMTTELKEKILVAKSVEEIAALLKEAGIDETQAERLWAEVEHKRKADGENLSLDELEAVSGGARDWAKDGCASTVEPGSWCWSNDQCKAVEEFYDNAPVSYNCPKCGMYFYKEIRESDSSSKPVYYVCKVCNYTEFAYYDTRDKAK